MYAYVFDSFVQDNKYRTESARIETRLSSLGIQGRSEKITILKSIQDSVKSMIKRGADTVIAVGNDLTVVKILPLVLEADVALGIIPVGPQQLVAQALGLPNGAAACDMLSRRIMKRVDVGEVGGAHFLIRADLPAGARVVCDGAYTVEAEAAEIPMSITNIGSGDSTSRPDDGYIELVVGGAGSGWFGRGGGERSVFPLRKAKIEKMAGEARLLLDGQLAVNPPVSVSVSRQKLHVIVGRNRAFD